MSLTPCKTLSLLAIILMMAVPHVSPAEGLRNGFQDAFGQRFGSQPGAVSPSVRHRPRNGFDRAQIVRQWNQVAIDASGMDHTPIATGENRTFGEQLGPGRSSRAMAMVHLAMFETVNALEGNYKSYVGLGQGRTAASMTAAVSQAAHDTLVSLYPSQTVTFDLLLEDELDGIAEGRLKTNGIALGRRVAAAVLAARVDDGSQHAEPRVGTDFIISAEPGKWRQDPMSDIPIALGAYWGKVKPFVIEQGAQFRIPPPPLLTSPEYLAAFQDVKRLGGDGVNTATSRSAEQTEIGIYWAYDGTPSLCAPPRLYNQIAMRIAKKMGTDTDPVELARLLALINVAMADAGIASWESKYFYQVARPITGIREADSQTGGDAGFTPLGAPASNLSGPNFTPPFPAYPSGHAVFGGALFQILRNFYRTDRIPFTFVSDEYNGVTKGNDGITRPFVERNFTTLSMAEEENARSRIYLGIHWSFDAVEGVKQGNQVADYVFKNLYRSNARR
jgi:PAP2 superfamily